MLTLESRCIDLDFKIIYVQWEGVNKYYVVAPIKLLIAKMQLLVKCYDNKMVLVTLQLFHLSVDLA